MPDTRDDLRLQIEQEIRISGIKREREGASPRRALVTGGSSGIGRGIALALGEAGFDIALTYLSGRDEAEVVQAYIRSRYGQNCEIYRLDTADEASVEAVAEAAWRDLDGIDVLVNNAGITIMEAAFEDTIEALDRLMSVNFRGSVLMLQHIAKLMRDRERGGSIINISSVHAANENRNDAIYGASKAALERATATYALQYAKHKIRVNSIAPGAILVDRLGPRSKVMDVGRESIPLGRIGVPLDVAHAVLFLASEVSSYITGISLAVDGGMSLGRQM